MKSGREHFQIRLEGAYLQNMGFSQHTRHILQGFLQYEDTYGHWILIKSGRLADESSMGTAKRQCQLLIHSESPGRLFAEVIWHLKLKQKQKETKKLRLLSS